MTTEKKPEAEWEEAERVGPYRLHEQVQPSEEGPVGLHRAEHEESGVSALVLKLGDEGGAAPPEELEVRCVVSASPGYLALEVRQSKWAVAADKHGMEALVCALGEVRGWLERMYQHVAEPEPRAELQVEPRPAPRRRRLALAGVAVVFALVFALWPESVEHEAVASSEMPDVHGPWYRDLTPAQGGIIARPLPPKPLELQKRPPCNPNIEVAIHGGCWVPAAFKAPCPKELYEHEGKCYLPSAGPPEPGQAKGK